MHFGAFVTNSGVIAMISYLFSVAQNFGSKKQSLYENTFYNVMLYDCGCS